MKLLIKTIKYVLDNAKLYNIDDSHGLSHSLNILYYTGLLYDKELKNYPNIKKYKKIIYCSAILHDMCDKKYINQVEGINKLKSTFINDFTEKEFEHIETIISKMSYSYVKKNGFPKISDELYIPYHIVREADLLTGYDFERAMNYKLQNFDTNLYDAYDDAVKLFNDRVLKHNDDNLFITKTGKHISRNLEKKTHKKLQHWKNILFKK